MRVTHHTGPRKLKEIPKNHHAKTKTKEALKTPKDLFDKYSVEEIKDWKSLDLYFLMGITQEDAKAYTELDYKEAFRKQAKLFHPDRLLYCKIEDGGASFVALSKAYDVLSNPHKKRLYDFIAFDESIPEDREYSPEEFFRVFSECFDRNLGFSTKATTLRLGDLTTKDSDVLAFYKFWQNFESLRSFDFLCREDDGQSREMRRHSAAQNKEMLDEKKSEDNQRIRKLVALSIKHDPRVNKDKKNQKKEPVTVDSDGWKNTEVDVLTKIAEKTPTRTRNRIELIFSAVSRYMPARNKREVQAKLLKIDAAIQKAQKK